MRKIRVLLADDHQIFLEGLKGLLEPEFDLVGIVEDGRALVKEAERLCPDVIVADISMPRNQIIGSKSFFSPCIRM